jgi:hypothetical protein
VTLDGYVYVPAVTPLADRSMSVAPVTEVSANRDEKLFAAAGVTAVPLLWSTW